MLGASTAFRRRHGRRAARRAARRTAACSPARCGRSSSAAPRRGGPGAAARKLEQTLYCELGPSSASSTTSCATTTASVARRAHRRGSGMGRSKIQILEALLRLRQAACHPGPRSTPSARRGAHRQARPAGAAARARCWRKGTRRWSSRSSPASWPSCASALDAAAVPYEYLDGQHPRPPGRASSAFQTDPRAASSSSSASRPAASASTSPPPTTSSCSTPGGTPPSKRRRSTAPTASARPPRLRLPPHRPRHGRGEDPRAPGHEARSGRAIIKADNSVLAGLSREDLEMLLS